MSKLSPHIRTFRLKKLKCLAVQQMWGVLLNLLAGELIRERIVKPAIKLIQTKYIFGV